MNRKKKEILTFIIIFIFSLIFLQGFVRMHYAADTYRIIDVGYETYAQNWSFRDGRIFMGLISVVSSALHININAYVIILTIAAIFISCITVIILKNIILSYKPAKSKYQDIFSLVVSYFTIFNFMYLENMYFVECTVMAISILFYILSAKSLVDRDKNHILKSLLFFIIAVFSYQGTVGIFFTTTIVFSFIKNKNQYREIIKDCLKCILIAFVGIMLNIIQVKIVNNILGTGQTRIGSIMNVPRNILYILKLLPRIFVYNCGLFPKLMLLVLVIVIYIIYLKKEHTDKRHLFNENQFCLFVLATIVSTCAVFSITLSSFDAGRMYFTIGAFLGLLFILLYCNTNIFDTKLKYFLVSIFAIYALTTVFCYIYITNEHRETNSIEYMKVMEIDKYIKEYEKETNNKVDKILIHTVKRDNYDNLCKETVNKNVINITALDCNWSIKGVIRFYTGRNLMAHSILVNKEDAIKEEYKCVEDALYINAYMY